MARITVLIHPQGNSEGSLKEAIDFFRPEMVFLISNPDAEQAQLVLKYLRKKNQSRLGRWVEGIEHSELIEIEDAFSEGTVLEMVNAVMLAKKKASEKAGNDEIELHIGLAGGTKLMAIGAALAAIESGVESTYYVNKETIHRQGGVIQIDFISGLTKALSWLRGHYKNKENLIYLEETIKREVEGTPLSEISSAAISEASNVSEKAVRNAMKKLKSHRLVEYDSKAKPQVYSSTILGRFVLGMIGAPGGDE